MTEAASTPELRRNRSFGSFLATQALGAFNDNVFRQVALLLAVGRVAFGLDFQAIVQFLFALPFLAFSGLAGDLADRCSKGTLMVACKVAEIGVMLLGVAVFLSAPREAGSEPDRLLWLLAAVVCFMGMQSAFFGPPKYGGLPELVRDDDLAPATGLTQMTTFLSIILGVATAGFLVDSFGDRLWVSGSFAVGVAVLGTLTSLGIARRPPSDPARPVSLRSLINVVRTLAEIVRGDRLLFSVMLLYSWFWLVGGVSLTSLNAFGLLQLGLSNWQTSVMVAFVSIGIAIGSAVVGRLSRGGVRLELSWIGLVGVVIASLTFVLLPAPVGVGEGTPAWSRWAAHGSCLLLGMAGGFFSVPLLAFVQARPRAADKGRVFAAVNWLNWLFILFAAAVHGVGMSVTGHRPAWLLAAVGGATALVGFVLVPGIRRHRARPA